MTHAARMHAAARDIQLRFCFKFTIIIIVIMIMQKTAVR